MMIWKIWQDVNNGYDTYSEAIVIAPDDTAARLIHPGGRGYDEWNTSEWAPPERVKAELIGVATGDAKPGVVCASFHAG